LPFRYSGLLEVCRIRKLGFPIRRDNVEFYRRYKVEAVCMESHGKHGGFRWLSKKNIKKLLNVFYFVSLCFKPPSHFIDCAPDHSQVIEPTSTNLESMIANLKASGKLPDGQFALGKTKVFMKNRAAQQMDVLREEAFVVQAIKVCASDPDKRSTHCAADHAQQHAPTCTDIH